MKCPIDGSDLVMSDRQGIEIDYCPKCRGVWLDRGELDKIIERSAGAYAAEGVGAPAQPAGAPPMAPPTAPQGYPASGYNQAPAYPPQAPYPQSSYPQGSYPPGYRRDDDDDDDRRRYDPRYGHDPRYGQHPHKRKSFLGELFDFD